MLSPRKHSVEYACDDSVKNNLLLPAFFRVVFKFVYWPITTNSQRNYLKNSLGEIKTEACGVLERFRAKETGNCEVYLFISISSRPNIFRKDLNRIK